MVSVKRYSYINALGMGFSGLLQLIGMMTPGWHRYRTKYPKENVYVGVCYSITCNNETCETEYHSDTSYYMKGFHALRPLQVQLIIALIAGVFVGVHILKSRKCTGLTLMKRLATNAHISVVSGALSLAPGATTVVRQFFYIGSSQYLFPYSAFLTCLGGILALVVSLISLHQIRSTQTLDGPMQQLSSTENREDCNSTLL